MKHSLSHSLVAATLVISSGILATQAFAKDTLIDLDNARVGGFGGPVFKTSRIKGIDTFEIGGQGGATFTTGKHSILLGGAGYGLVNELDWDYVEDNQNKEGKLEMGYGGFILGYTYNPEGLAHVDSSLLLGAGGVQVISDDSQSFDSASFLITELASQLEINVTDFLEVGVGGAYRLVTNPSIDNLSGDDLSGPSLFISFQFGSL